MKKLLAFLGILAAAVVIGILLFSGNTTAQEVSCEGQCKAEYNDCLTQANEYSEEEKQSQVEQCKADLESCTSYCDKSEK